MAKTLTVKLVHSAICRDKKQKQTLIGLGLNKLNKEVTLQDNPSTIGMIEKVKHLVKIVEKV